MLESTQPIRYAPSLEIEEGVFYTPRTRQLFQASRYYEDDGIDEDGCIAYIIGAFDLTGGNPGRYDDAEYTGYHSLDELLDDMFTTDCMVLTDRPIGEPGTVSELHCALLEYEGIDLSMTLDRLDREVWTCATDGVTATTR